MRLSLTAELAARMRPRKYASRSEAGRVSGISDSVDAAGRRDPCLERRSSAGGRLGLFGGGGLRYSDKRVW